MAGLLEGEGHFGWSPRPAGKGGNRPVIEVRSVDRDVIERLHELTGGYVRGPIASRGIGRQPQWRWRAEGGLAVALMRSLESLMCKRRRSRIGEILEDLDAAGRYADAA